MRKGRQKGFIFVISGPSGSGKTTLLKELLKDRQIKRHFVKSISFTTRPKRSGERNGRDYFFISEKGFNQEKRAKKILEWTRYLGYYYATPREFIESQLSKGRHIGLCLDLKGALRIKRLYPERAKTIFVVPPSLQTLRSRIEARCSKTKKEEIKKRLQLAQEELAVSRKYDYRVFNHNLKQATEGLKKIVLTVINPESETAV